MGGGTAGGTVWQWHSGNDRPSAPLQPLEVEACTLHGVGEGGEEEEAHEYTDRQTVKRIHIIRSQGSMLDGLCSSPKWCFFSLTRSRLFTFCSHSGLAAQCTTCSFCFGRLFLYYTLVCRLDEVRCLVCLCLCVCA